MVATRGRSRRRRADGGPDGWCGILLARGVRGSHDGGDVSIEPMDIAATIAAAEAMEERFLALVRDLERVDKGVRASEMLFLCATVAALAPRRFLESGTAGGQSTLQMALVFPEAEIVTHELNEDDRYARIARERLAPFERVHRRFGNAVKMIPAVLEPGDVVLIDGPKGFKALRFAFELLGTRKPAAVFIHDLHLGLPERRFLDSGFPGAFFSDDPAWVWHFGYLDTRGKNRDAWRQGRGACPAAGTQPTERYGATFGCLPGDPPVAATRLRYLLAKRGVIRAAHLVPEKIFNPMLRRLGLAAIRESGSSGG